MMIERSCMFVAMVMTMSISAGIIHAAKDTESIVIKYDAAAAAAAADSDSLLRGHRRVDGEDCLSIIDIVCDDSDDYTQLCELLKEFDLADALGVGEWTVFVPTEDALKGVDWDSLTDDQIKDVILFHTVEGTVINSSDLSCSDTIEMGNGDDSRTKCKGGSTYQTGIGNLGMDLIPQIIDQDIEACNGIIHIIDSVMLPKLSKTFGDRDTDDTSVNDNDDGDDDEDYEGLKGRVDVQTEWDQLEEVILGGYTQVTPVNSTSIFEMMKIFPQDDWEKIGPCGTEQWNRNWGVADEEPPNSVLPTKTEDIKDGKEADCTGVPDDGKKRWCCAYNHVKEEADNLLKVLRKYNVKVLRPRGESLMRRRGNFGGMQTQGAQNQFSRDPMQIIDNVILELTPGAANRRGEILNYDKIFNELKQSEPNMNIIQMPARSYEVENLPGNFAAPNTTLDKELCGFLFDAGLTKEYNCIGPYDKQEHAVLEGGDFMLMGDTIIVGHSENRAMGSSPKGIEWVRHTLKSLGIDKKVVGVLLDSRILHLDIVMSLPCPGLAIVADLPFPDGSLPFPNGLPKELLDWELLHVSAMAGQFMAANCLPINTKVIVMANNSLAPTKYQDEIAGLHQKMRDRGFIVEVIDFGYHGMMGGALRCSTHPIRRNAQKNPG